MFEDEALLEAALCTEVVLCVLDTLETIIRVISMPGSDHLHFALPMVLKGMVRDLFIAYKCSAFKTKPPPDAHVRVQSIRAGAGMYIRKSTNASEEILRCNI